MAVLRRIEADDRAEFEAVAFVHPETVMRFAQLVTLDSHVRPPSHERQSVDDLDPGGGVS